MVVEGGEERSQDHEHKRLNPVCTVEHLLNCQFQAWYPSLRQYTFRSCIIELSESDVAYLTSEEQILKLPKGFNLSCGEGGQGWSSDSDDGVEDHCRHNGVAVAEQCSDDDDYYIDDVMVEWELPVLLKSILRAIKQLGGDVLPKLNWSSPQDAVWVNGGTLKCQQPGDVMALLKSSVFVTYDLLRPFSSTSDETQFLHRRPDKVVLVLRKWCNMKPSMHFRCFVRNKRLIGICQRDCTQCFDFLGEESSAQRISALLVSFLNTTVLSRFPDPSFVMDAYVNEDGSPAVHIVDMNVFAVVTDSLLFSWTELSQEGQELKLTNPSSTGIWSYQLITEDGSYETVFRAVCNTRTVYPDSLAEFRGPEDVATMANADGSIDFSKLIYHMQQQQ